MKTILTIFVFFMSFTQVLATVGPEAKDKPHAVGIVSVRAGAHDGFHRLVFELTAPVRYSVERETGQITLRLRNVDLRKALAEKPATGLLSVKGAISIVDDKGALATSVRIAVKKGSRVRDSIRKDPYRVVLDVYPAEAAHGHDGRKTEPDAGTKEDASGTKREAPDVSRIKAEAQDPGAKQEAQSKTFPDFNVFGGWRWEYRKKIIGLLEEDIIKNDSGAVDLLGRELGVQAADKKAVIKEAWGIVSGLKASGESEKADVLAGIIRFFDGDKDPSSLEDFLRTHQGTDYDRLGWFLLASYYEKNGFYTEAGGYYSRIINSKGGGAVHTAAMFCRGRLLFFDGKYDESKKWFLMSSEAGFPSASLWLANALFIKGETQNAWSIYSRRPSGMMDAVDPVTILSMADINLTMRNFDEAGRLYSILLARLGENTFEAAYVNLRGADALLLEGKRDDAAKAYFRIKEVNQGEGLALAALHLADLLAANNDHASLKRAWKYYRDVAEGEYTGSEAALLNSAVIDARLGKHEDAVSSIERFVFKYTTSPLRSDAQALKGRVVSAWIAARHDKGDHYGVVGIYYRYASAVPYGKKAETFLRAGRSFAAISLYSEAVGALNSAIKIGRDSVVEEAYVSLAAAYLAQRDAGAVERLVKAFGARFPKSANKEALDKILLRAMYMKGDYVSVATLGAGAKDGALVMLRASALYRLKNYKEAHSEYERAAALSGAHGGDGLGAAYLGMADSAFMLLDYGRAAEGYGAAVKEMKEKGANGVEDMSWALYRMARCYSRLGRNAQMKKALEELRAIKGDFGDSAGPVFKEASDFKSAG